MQKRTPRLRGKLPVELGADLANTGIAGTRDLSEGRVVDIPTRVSELRVVEYVEKFETDIESIVLMNRGPLQYAEIGVVKSGAMEEAPVGGSKGPQSSIGSKRIGQEITPCSRGTTGIRQAWIHDFYGTDTVRHIRGRAVRQ